MSIYVSKEEVLPFGLIVLTFVLGLFLKSILPAQLPTHWSAQGSAEHFVNTAFIVYFVPGAVLLLYVFLLRLPMSDPLRRNLEGCAHTLFWIRTSIITFLLLFYVYFLGAVIGVWPAHMNIALTLDFSYLFLMFSRHLPHLRRNYFYGIRTPWTLESNQVWYKTHVLAGEIFALLAVVNIVGVLLPRWSFWITLLLIVGAACWLVGYSAREYRRENPRGAL